MYKKQVSRHTLTITRRPLFLLQGNYFKCIQSLKMNLIGVYVESIKMWQNILDTLCFQRTTSGIKHIDFIRSTLGIPCQYLKIYIINLIP